MNNQKGFTLIELVVVIVVLGILAAVAMPKFVDLQTEAREAAVKGVAGGLASASALNYAAKVTGKTTAVATTTGCTTAVAAGLLTSFDSTNYTLSGSFSGTPSVGDSTTCTVTDANDTSITATFDLIYVD